MKKTQLCFFRGKRVLFLCAQVHQHKQVVLDSDFDLLLAGDNLQLLEIRETVLPTWKSWEGNLPASQKSSSTSLGAKQECKIAVGRA